MISTLLDCFSYDVDATPRVCHCFFDIGQVWQRLGLAGHSAHIQTLCFLIRLFVRFREPAILLAMVLTKERVPTVPRLETAHDPAETWTRWHKCLLLVTRKEEPGEMNCESFLMLLIASTTAAAAMDKDRRQKRLGEREYIVWRIRFECIACGGRLP